MSDPARVGFKLGGLQVLRFLAAFLVIWAHLKFAVGPSQNPLVQTAAGAVGVDVFFVISGFVISLSASRLGRNFRLFFAHRLARILPLYYMLSLLIFANEALKQHSLGDFNRFWNSFFFLPFFDVEHYTAPYHGYGWTLGFEVWFYFLFGILLASFGSRRSQIICPLFIGGGVLIFSFFRGSWVMPWFVFNPMTLEFVAGILLFRFREKIGIKTFGCLLLGLPFLLTGVLLTDGLGEHMQVLADPALAWSRTLLWGGFAFCLVGSVVYLDQEKKLRYPKWMVGLGDASYSIYLIQPFAIKFALETMDGGFLGGFVFTVVSVLGGLALYRLFEQPLGIHVRPRLERLFRASLPEMSGSK